MRNLERYLGYLFIFSPLFLIFLFPPEPEKVRVFILAGQSNMVGHADAAESSSVLDSEIVVFDGEGIWKTAVDARVGLDRGPSLFFAREVQEETGDVVGLIQCAVDRSSIDSWDSSLWEECLEKVKKAGLGGERELAAMLFMQGESEALSCEPGWREKFTDLVLKFRDRLAFKLPVIFVQIPNMSAPCYDQVQKQQELVRIPEVKMIESNDLWVGEDFHFDLAGYEMLGRRLAEAYLEEYL